MDAVDISDLALPVHAAPAIRPETIEYRVVRSARRRRTIEIALDAGDVIVRSPLRTPDAEIRAVVRQRAAWILRRLGESSPVAPLVAGATVPYRGAPVRLEVVPSARDRTTVQLGLFALRIDLPQHLAGAACDEAVREAVAGWLRARATTELPQRVEARARATGLQPARVLVRDQRRRWGSCAPDGALRFNWRLIMLDDALIDYVAVHELAHLRAPNHGPAFWREVERWVPDHRVLRRRLREEGRRLPF